MKRILITLVLGAFVVTTVDAEIIITNPVARDIGQSYGFCFGQELSLERISTEFPSLTGVALLAEKEFAAAFGDSLSKMDARMSSLSPQEWQEIKANMKRQLDENTGGLTLTQAEAEQFVQIVRNRAKGDLPSPVLETLLMFKPRYQRNPMTEFTDGYTQRQEDNGSGKAKGVAFSLKAPRSWKAMEGNRPNIVTKFVSENGRGLEMFLVIIKPVPLEPGESITAADISEILNPNDVADMLPEGATYLSSGNFTLETLPGYWVRFDVRGTRGRQSISMSSIMYTIFYQDRMIQMQGQVGAAGGESDDSSDRFKKFEKLFDLMAQSFVLPQVYNQ